MDQAIHKGTVTFIHHDKQYVTIEYVQNGKEKTINGKIDEVSGTAKSGKKHKFRIGDEVNFQVKLSDRGDRMIAYNLKFLYNTALERLINQSKVENRFVGYLKLVDDTLYVKERDSYIFFPLKLSKWENPPAESASNDAITFKLVNTDKPHAMAAELFSHDFLPAYRKALEHFNNKAPVEATVSKVSPYAVYIDMLDGQIQAKMPLHGESLEEVKAGDQFKVLITYLGSDRIVVKKA